MGDGETGRRKTGRLETRKLRDRDKERRETGMKMGDRQGDGRK